MPPAAIPIPAEGLAPWEILYNFFALACYGARECSPNLRRNTGPSQGCGRATCRSYTRMTAFPTTPWTTHQEATESCILDAIVTAPCARPSRDLVRPDTWAASTTHACTPKGATGSSENWNVRATSTPQTHICTCTHTFLHEHLGVPSCGKGRRAQSQGDECTTERVNWARRCRKRADTTVNVRARKTVPKARDTPRGEDPAEPRAWQGSKRGPASCKGIARRSAGAPTGTRVRRRAVGPGAEPKRRTRRTSQHADEHPRPAKTKERHTPETRPGPEAPGPIGQGQGTQRARARWSGGPVRRAEDAEQNWTAAAEGRTPRTARGSSRRTST